MSHKVLLRQERKIYRRSGSGITAGKQQEVRELLDEERRVRSVLLSQTAPVTDSKLILQFMP